MIQLLIISNNRAQYLEQVFKSLDKHLPGFASKAIVQNDDDYAGMAANIQRGWARALENDWAYLLHFEDDMLLIRKPSLDLMVEALDAHPNVANMMLKRQPWNDIEQDAGDVLGAIRGLAKTYVDHGTWAAHDHIFSLNPCLIPRRIVEKGWPAGNEQEQTERLRKEGYLFGCWGSIKSPPVISHIGYERGPGWRL